MATSVHQVAESLINLSYEKNNPVSNLKLQKLLYYSQAWHLALYKCALIDDEIEAWVHGPVVPCVFRRYRDFKWNAIGKPGAVQMPDFVPHLEEVWRVYGGLRAFDL